MFIANWTIKQSQYLVGTVKLHLCIIYIQGASQVDQANIPDGSEQVFVMSQNISNSIKEDLAWGTYILLRNTNTVSVVSARFHKTWLDLRILWLLLKFSTLMIIYIKKKFYMISFCKWIFCFSSLYQFKVHYVFAATGIHLKIFQKVMHLVGLRNRLNKLVSPIWRIPFIFHRAQVCYNSSFFKLCQQIIIEGQYFHVSIIITHIYIR